MTAYLHIFSFVLGAGWACLRSMNASLEPRRTSTIVCMSQTRDNWLSGGWIPESASGTHPRCYAFASALIWWPCLQRFFMIMLIFMAVMLLICLCIIYISYAPTTWPLVAKYGKLMDSQDSILRAFAAFTMITCTLFVVAQYNFHAQAEWCCNYCLSGGEYTGCCVKTATFYQTNATCNYCYSSEW